MNEKEKSEYTTIEHLFLEKRQVLTVQAFKFVNDMQEAHDIVSESFISLIEHRDNVNPDKYSEYLYQIMRNKCLTRRKLGTIHQNIYNRIAEREGRMMDIYTKAIEGTTMSEVQTSEIISIYKRQMKKLTPLQRTIFTKSRMDGMTRSKIASELGISENKVKYEISSALAILKAALHDYSEYLGLIMLILGGIDIQ